MNKIIKCERCRGDKKENQPCLGCFTLDLMRKQKEEKKKVDNNKKI